MPYAQDRLVALSASLTTSIQQSTGLGTPLLVCTETEAPLDSDRYRVYTSAAAVQADIDGSDIGATAGAWALSMFAQATVPLQIIVGKYNPAASPTPETPATLYDALVSAGVDWAVDTSVTVTDTVLEQCAAWHNATNARRWRYMMVAQSANAALQSGGTKPAGLDELEYETCRLIAVSSATATNASAYAARCASAPFIRQAVGAKAQIVSTAAAFTDVVADHALGLDCGVAMPLAPGVYASTIELLGEESYGGQSWSAAMGTVYFCRNARNALTSFWARVLAGQIRVSADYAGVAQAASVVQPLAAQMAGSGWFTPTAELPQGYEITGTVSSGNIQLIARLSYPGEVQTIQLSVEGEVL